MVVPKKYIGNILLLVYFFISLFIMPASNVYAEPVFDWEAQKYGYTEDYGVDKENNYMFFYRGADDNTSRTWISKYSPNGNLIFNNSIDINYGFFTSKEEVIDVNNNTYIVYKGHEKIHIWKYDEQWNLLKFINITTEVTNHNFATAEIFVTNLGTIYLFCVKEYEILDLTYARRVDVLYKINENGKANWDIDFESIAKRSERYPADVSEYFEGVLFFNYDNELFKINTKRGKIKWNVEVKEPIRGLVAFGEEVCIAYCKETIGTALEVAYYSADKTELWKKTYYPELGLLTLRKIEIKLDKIAVHFWDNIDGGVTKETIENYKTINTQGENLVDISWQSSVYFLHWRHFHLAYMNSFYVHYENNINSTTYISKYSFEAPEFTLPTNPSVGFEAFSCVIALLIIISARRKLKMNLEPRA